MKRCIILSAVFLIILIPLVQGQSSYCYIDTDCTNFSNMLNPLTTYINLGYVSLQGHYSDVASTPGFTNTYALCCPDSFVLDTGNTGWKFSRMNPPLENGSGHVGINESLLPHTVSVGTEGCLVADSCPADYTLMFNVSNDTNSHVMDGYHPDNPVPNLYDKSMCCKLTEICFDGVDNDLDGKIDCADADCNQDFFLGGDPKECTNMLVDPKVSSPFNTSRCIDEWWIYPDLTIEINWSKDCLGQNPPNFPGRYYHCNFGPTDDPADQLPGVCCPVDTVAKLIGASWQCIPSEPCQGKCGFDYTFEFNDWLAKVYAGDPLVWCHSAVPELYSPGQTPDPKSAACCIIEKYSELGYYTDDRNVKIYG